jgi:simple sugar transport system ATP-binding protein
VLARELGGDVRVLIAANPCFGLDFAALADIRAQLIPTTTSALDRLIFPAYAASKDSDHYQEAENVSGMSDRRRAVHRPYV